MTPDPVGLGFLLSFFVAGMVLASTGLFELIERWSGRLPKGCISLLVGLMFVVMSLVLMWIVGYIPAKT